MSRYAPAPFILALGLAFLLGLLAANDAFVRPRPTELPPAGDGTDPAPSCRKDVRLAG